LGFLIIISGELIRIWAVSYAGSETRTTGDAGGTFLVTQGPYSIVRNPLYIGNMIIYFGIGVMSNALFPYLSILALIFFGFQYYTIIKIEEEYLEKTFKTNYLLYKKSVKRFLPVSFSVPSSIKSNLQFLPKEGLLSEKRTLQAITISILIIVLLFILKIRFLHI
jgi:protein-S-isoprenylcysteine O-methyltransferase Ste14